MVVTAYELERREPFFFKTFEARNNTEWDFYIKNAARADTSRNVLIFFASPGKKFCEWTYTLVDCGVIINNPSEQALISRCKATLS